MRPLLVSLAVAFLLLMLWVAEPARADLSIVDSVRYVGGTYGVSARDIGVDTTGAVYVGGVKLYGGPDRFYHYVKYSGDLDYEQEDSCTLRNAGGAPTRPVNIPSTFLVDDDGSVYITGKSYIDSTCFPITCWNALTCKFEEDENDSLVLVLDTWFNRDWPSSEDYDLSKSGQDLAFDTGGNVYIAVEGLMGGLDTLQTAYIVKYGTPYWWFRWHKASDFKYYGREITVGDDGLIYFAVDKLSMVDTVQTVVVFAYNALGSLLDSIEFIPSNPNDSFVYARDIEYLPGSGPGYERIVLVMDKYLACFRTGLDSLEWSISGSYAKAEVVSSDRIAVIEDSGTTIAVYKVSSHTPQMQWSCQAGEGIVYRDLAATPDSSVVAVGDSSGVKYAITYYSSALPACDNSQTVIYGDGEAVGAAVISDSIVYVTGTSSNADYLTLKLLYTAPDTCATDTCNNGQVNYCAGDVDGSGSVNVADLTHLLNYLFFEGPPPVPLEAGDLDGQCGINVSDLAYLADFLFYSGTPPVCEEDCI
jgi:hypothetical protein